MSYGMLFQKTYEMMKWIYPAVNKFPRKQRLILSQRIETTAIRILELVIDMSQRDTATNRRKIIYEVHKLQILFRICKDLSYLSFRKYEHVSEMLKEISYILDELGGGVPAMQACENLYDELCSFENLCLAYRKARKGKSSKPYVADFSMNMEQELMKLKKELEDFSYNPRPLKKFVIRDPKTRVISASDFRDRIVHHALCNIIGPVFEKSFIHDSYANRKGKGTHAAMKRFDAFKKKVSGNGRILPHAKDTSMVAGYVLKADIKHCFNSIDHYKMLEMIGRKIKDRDVMWLMKKIIRNSPNHGKGMPLGNLTSQFFANVYLTELDTFVKHELNARFYIRYMDDFLIMDSSYSVLEEFKKRISFFLECKLKIELHPEKSNIIPLHKGTNFLGFRIFYYYKLPKKSNFRAMERRIGKMISMFSKGEMEKSKVMESMEGWNSYAIHGNTYKARRSMSKRIRNELDKFREVHL